MLEVTETSKILASSSLTDKVCGIRNLLTAGRVEPHTGHGVVQYTELSPSMNMVIAGMIQDHWLAIKTENGFACCIAGVFSC